MESNNPVHDGIRTPPYLAKSCLLNYLNNGDYFRLVIILNNNDYQFLNQSLNLSF